MQDHRVRLDDREVEIICAALRARRAGMKSEKGRKEIEALLHRLFEMNPGNPNWRLAGLLNDR